MVQSTSIVSYSCGQEIICTLRGLSFHFYSFPFIDRVIDSFMFLGWVNKFLSQPQTFELANNDCIILVASKLNSMGYDMYTH